MIALEDNKLKKLVNTAKTLDIFIKKSIKLLVGLAVLTFVLYIFFTTENIIKYLSPLYSKTTLWTMCGIIGTMYFVKSTWFMELIIRTSGSLFGAVLFGSIFPFVYGIFLWIIDNLIHKDGGESILYHAMYMFDMYKNIVTSENSNFVLLAVLIFAILNSIADMTGIKNNNYHDDSLVDDEFEEWYVGKDLSLYR